VARSVVQQQSIILISLMEDRVGHHHGSEHPQVRLRNPRRQENEQATPLPSLYCKVVSMVSNNVVKVSN
jgi:hypothetical protein